MFTVTTNKNADLILFSKLQSKKLFCYIEFIYNVYNKIIFQNIYVFIVNTICKLLDVITVIYLKNCIQCCS